VFEEEDLVLLPSDYRDEPCWARLQDCRWDAPQYMLSRKPLKFLYETHFGGQKKVSILRRFFNETLGVSDCKWVDFVDELEALKHSGCKDILRITAIYEHLARIKKNIPSKDRAKYKYVSSEY
jgi:hypothetical protein